MTNSAGPDIAGTADLVVVGGGIVGLAHAWHAARAGRSVILLERDEVAVGASVRNFGHLCATAQDGLALELALAAREHWLTLGRDAGLEVQQHGTVVVARHDDELAVLEAFAASRGAEQARMLTAREVTERMGFAPANALGGALLPMDLRIDPLSAAAQITAHLIRLGVDVRTRTTALTVEPGRVETTRGTVRADEVVLAIDHDVDRFFPDVADGIGLLRCRLRMLEADAPRGAVVRPAVLTGTSLLRYDGFTALPETALVWDRVRRETPALVEQDVNLMLTQRPDGVLVLGDTHHRSVTESPFEDEASDELLLAEFRRLLDTDALQIRRRWRGVYASSPRTPFLVAEPLPGVRAVSVTTGIGMTCALGLAERVLAGAPLPATP